MSLKTVERIKLDELLRIPVPITLEAQTGISGASWPARLAVIPELWVN